MSIGRRTPPGIWPPPFCRAAGLIILGAPMQHTFRIASSYVTVDLTEDDDGVWTASMTFRGQLLEARSERAADAEAALLVALKSELSH